MKLFGYEFMKWFKKRLLLVLVPLLLVGSGYLYVKDAYNHNGYLLRNMEAYNQAEREYAALPLEQGYEQIKRKNAELLKFQRVAMVARNPDNPLLAEEWERIRQETPNILEEFKGKGYAENPEELRLDAYIFGLLLKQYEAMHEYRDYVSGVRQRAEELLGVSIFQNERSFSYRNIVRTPQDFAALTDLPLQLGYEGGIVSATTFRITDLLMIIILVLLCIYLFQYEKDAGLVRLTRSTIRGRSYFVTGKLAALVSMSTLLSVFFYGSLLLLANHLYGFGDPARYVQSMEAFRYCHLPLTVKQYLILFLVGKTVANILAALAISTLFVVFGNMFSVYGGLSLLLAVEYLAYRFIHPLSPLQLLKYVNLFAYYDTYGLLAVYRNLNMGGYPVQNLLVAIASSVVLILLLAAGSILFYALRQPFHVPAGFHRWMVQLFRKLWKPPASVSLFRHESRKLFFSGKTGLILIAALFIAYQDVHKEEIRFNEEDAIYNQPEIFIELF